MRAAQVTGPGQVRIVERPLPQPGRGEVRVALEGCGVCASNLEPWAGPVWMTFPAEPGGLGHEGWGRIDALGDGVTAFARGDRVAFLGSHSYATHEIVAAPLAVPLPTDLDALPMPGEALGCAVSIFDKARIAAGDTVAVVGAGFIGLALTRLAAQAGARVIAISRRPGSLALARQMGASGTVPMHDHRQIIERLRDLTDGRMADVTIEAVGRQWPLDLAAELTRESGRLVIAGYHQDGPRQVNMQLWNWRAFDIVNAHERDRGRLADAMRRAVALVQKGALDPRPLLTHRYPLERLAAALDATREKPAGFVKGWIACS